jgi:hypothetical protein
VAWAARWPSAYLEHVRGIPPPHPYPLESVAFVILFMTVEVAVIAVLVHPRAVLGPRTRQLIALVIAVGFLAYGALGLMHSDTYYLLYCLWMLVLAIGLLAGLLWTTAVGLRTKLSPQGMSGKGT